MDLKSTLLYTATNKNECRLDVHCDGLDNSSEAQESAIRVSCQMEINGNQWKNDKLKLYIIH